MTARLEAFRKPVIAAINGIAFGGGCEITEAVHLAIASDQRAFAKPEINLGMPPTFGGTQRLPRLAGRKRALELLLTGEPFAPARALEIGLVNSVVPHDELVASRPRPCDAHHPSFATGDRRYHHRRDPRSEHGHCRRAAGRERAIRPLWCRATTSAKASPPGSRVDRRIMMADDDFARQPAPHRNRHCEERKRRSNPSALQKAGCFAEPVIGRAFARPVGSQ